MQDRREGALGCRSTLTEFVAGLNRPMLVTGHDFNLERRQHGAAGDHRRQSGRGLGVNCRAGSVRGLALGAPGLMRVYLQLPWSGGVVPSAGPALRRLRFRLHLRNRRGRKPEFTVLYQNQDQCEQQKSQGDEHLPPLFLFRIIPKTWVQLPVIHSPPARA